ncbi:SAM-dependent methyltransferase [Photobacterium damselae subsp. damselae]|uniref:class I SAM-dependent methyltransferase n=1 Tax=Photobacterium damselae TaxID=38293 RepID=UPI000D07C9CF|nr:class I SAM-dependent methyltransferase [Photobacterium damselae]PSB88890.1 SAM-dependent methyltransferase [Photobacterium damselae subsp. damselae]
MSVDFYNTHADDFYQSTVNVDVSPLLERFIPYLLPHAHVLDAGCGSGRDSKSFLDMDYQVTAIDASEELSKRAEQLIGQSVEVTTFQNFTSQTQFDGIWACASLLHVPSHELASVFNKLSNMLVTGGAFYCSFKYGDDDVERNGRFFTNSTEQRLQSFLVGTPLQIKETWITGDLRPGREAEKWLNVILVKQDD